MIYTDVWASMGQGSEHGEKILAIEQFQVDTASVVWDQFETNFICIQQYLKHS